MMYECPHSKCISCWIIAYKLVGPRLEAKMVQDSLERKEERSGDMIQSAVDL